MDEYTIHLLRKLAVNKYKVPARDRGSAFYVNKKGRAMRDTGSSDTSLGNSTVMGYAWIFCLFRLIDADRFSCDLAAEVFLELGFKMKLKKLDLDDATFLKGMWLHCEGGYHWAPLPSRVLKMGKSIKDPRTIYHTRDFQEAAVLFCSDIAHSFSLFVAVPFVRVFVKNFMVRQQVRSEINPYKITASSAEKPLLAADGYEQLFRRYGFAREEMDVAEMNFPRHVFEQAVDPVYELLVAADYA